MTDLEWFTELFKKLSNEGFTGSLQLNFFKGQIGNINKSESFKKDSFVISPE